MNKKVIVLLSSMVLFLAGTYVCLEVMDTNKTFEDVPVVKVEKATEKKEKEKMIQPVKDGVKIVKGYYDQTLEKSDKENALVYFEGVYRPNDGIDYANENQDFEVYAVLSGTVIQKESDPLLGNILAIDHGYGIVTTYSSIEEMKVEKGDKVKQGDVLALAGTNVYQSDLKKHLHFMLTIHDVTYNPVHYFDKTIDKIK